MDGVPFLFPSFPQGVDVFLHGIARPQGWVEIGDGWCNGGGLAKGLDCACELPRVFDHALRIRCPNLRQGRQPGEPLRFGKVCPSPHRPAIRQGHAMQGPTSFAGHQLNGLHVNVVNVGSFLPVHLDVDKVRIHLRGGLLVGECLTFHDMAPMASAVTNGDDDQPRLSLCPIPRGGTPWHPVDRVVLMLPEVGRPRPRQCIGAFRIRGWFRNHRVRGVTHDHSGNRVMTQNWA